MVLVDGGILENIPVEVVRDMGAQLVIAVALETPKAKPEQFKSVADVLRQSVSIAIAQNERRSLALADIVISVDTTRFSGTDYEKWKEIIQAGCGAARGRPGIGASATLRRRVDRVRETAQGAYSPCRAGRCCGGCFRRESVHSAKGAVGVEARGG